MKTVVQLDDQGYFVGTTVADESPLDPGTFLMPAGTVDTEAPDIPEGMRAKWRDSWVMEAAPQPNVAQPADEPWVPTTYAEMRALAYPPITDYLDGIVKGDQAQVDAYIAACLAVKVMYPKPGSDAALASGTDGSV